MTLTIRIDLDNDAMQNTREIARVARQAVLDAEAREEKQSQGTVRDVNGNTVCNWTVA